VALATDMLWRGALKTDWIPAAEFRAVVMPGSLPSMAERHALVARVPTAFVLFGLMEHGGVSAVHRLAASDAWSSPGTPVAGARLDIVDAEGRAVPAGIPGRLRVPGSQLAAGHGMRARRLADGRVQLLEDDASLLWADSAPFAASAVESVLRAVPAVTDCAVVTRRDLSGAARVVAYVVSQDGVRIADAELRAAVRAQLPQRCVPNRIVVCAAIPLTPSGERKLSALESPFVPVVAADVRTAPQTEQEVLLLSIVSDVLGSDRVSVQDNFFKLGGTSLLCFRVVERVRSTTGQALSPRALLVGTLEQAAAELAQQPVTSAQQRDANETRSVFGRLKGFISG
jgi:AMP-binding enzyme C-terminal domain/Phosphopantetheine attachment site